MPRFDKEMVFTIVVVETAAMMMFFGLKIDHDTLEREMELATEIESSAPNSVDYSILRNSRRVNTVPDSVGNPLFGYALERLSK